MVTFSDVKKQLREFHSSFPRPGVPDLLDRLTEVRSAGGENWAQLWAQSGTLRQYAENACVYFFFDNAGELRYIGSTRTLGHRFFQHFDKKGAVWKSRASSLAVLPLPKASWFEVSAIESYLIEILNPPDNTVGKRHDQTI